MRAFSLARLLRTLARGNRHPTGCAIHSNAKSKAEIVVMGILIIGAIAWLFDLAMRGVERRVVPWKGRG